MATRATILNSTLKSIADAIRSKRGTTGTILPSEMANSILGISTGVDTSNATLTSGASLLSGVTAYGKDGTLVMGTIHKKPMHVYTPGTSMQSISSGVYLSGAQHIVGSANLISENIADGVEIFGVTGTKKPSVSVVSTAMVQGTTLRVLFDHDIKGTIYGVGMIVGRSGGSTAVYMKNDQYIYADGSPLSYEVSSSALLIYNFGSATINAIEGSVVWY